MKSWITPASELSGWDVLLRLTLIELLLRPGGPWGILPFVLVMSCAGLIFTKALRAPILWFGLFVLTGVRIFADWPLPDNHIYLLAYWCLAIFLSLRSPLNRLTLATSSRLLLGFAFALAVLWKGVFSPDFTDGRFFRVTLLTDERFASPALLFGGLTEAQLDQDRAYLNPLPEGAELLHPPKLIEPPRLRRFGFLATWGSLLLEASIAFLFLIPFERLYWLRHVALLLFCLVTYPFAPVAGFGWLLLVMGMSQIRPEHRVLKAVYITAYFFVLVFAEIPWAGAIVDSMQ
jgi:hypothetical protein